MRQRCPKVADTPLKISIHRRNHFNFYYYHNERFIVIENYCEFMNFFPSLFLTSFLHERLFLTNNAADFHCVYPLVFLALLMNFNSY